MVSVQFNTVTFSVTDDLGHEIKVRVRWNNAGEKLVSIKPAVPTYAGDEVFWFSDSNLETYDGVTTLMRVAYDVVRNINANDLYKLGTGMGKGGRRININNGNG